MAVVGLGRLFHETDEVVSAILIIGNVDKEGVEHIAECCEVVIKWLTHDGLEGYCHSGKESCDFFRNHCAGDTGCSALLAKWHLSGGIAARRYEEEHGDDKIYLLDL